MKTVFVVFAAAVAASAGADDAISAARAARPAKERVVIMCAHPDDFSGVSGMDTASSTDWTACADWKHLERMRKS